MPQVPRERRDVVVIGAGPVGLACAIEARRRGLSVRVFDKGTLVNSIFGYPTNMEFFSTPDLIEIGGYPFPGRWAERVVSCVPPPGDGWRRTELATIAVPLGRVAELADAQDSGSCVREDVGVQLPPRPPPIAG